MDGEEGQRESEKRVPHAPDSLLFSDLYPPLPVHINTHKFMTSFFSAYRTIMTYHYTLTGLMRNN